MLDDQALLLNVRDKELVVITGCGHSGIVNTLRRDRLPVRKEADRRTQPIERYEMPVARTGRKLLKTCLVL